MVTFPKYSTVLSHFSQCEIYWEKSLISLDILSKYFNRLSKTQNKILVIVSVVQFTEFQGISL